MLYHLPDVSEDRLLEVRGHEQSTCLLPGDNPIMVLVNPLKVAIVLCLDVRRDDPLRGLEVGQRL